MGRFIDTHYDNRKKLKLFNPVELHVELVGQTKLTGLDTWGDGVCTERTLDPMEIPGYVARMSHGSAGWPEANKKLTTKLLTFNPPHKTPFEFMQWVFKITGVSKVCLTQFDRNRVGIGFVQMSGRYMDRSDSGFIYNAYASKAWDTTDRCAVNALLTDSAHNEYCHTAYENAIQAGLSREDARRLLPVSQATGTYVYMNSSSLKQFFNERLRPATEWETRRLAQAMFDIVYYIAPNHFEQEHKLLQETL